MKYLYVVLIGAAIVTVRVWTSRRRSIRRARQDAAPDAASEAHPARPSSRAARGALPTWSGVEDALGDVGKVATREIRERVRGRILRVGTLIVLVVVAIAIIVPSLHKSTGRMPQPVGIVGGLSPPMEHLVRVEGLRNQDSVTFVTERSLAEAKTDLRSGKVAFAIVDGDKLLLYQPATASSSPADPTLVQDVAEYLGVLEAYRTAGLTPLQATEIDGAKPVPVQTLAPSSKSTTKATSVFGLVLLFFMLTQYNTWILIGVMQEKSSRVVEVLLATVRPIQLLGGKVLGIGVVALGQATIIVGFALVLGAAVGSNLLHATAPLVLACQLLWLLLGYAFYCWVYAAAGSTAERQDQVQTLAIPLSIPILLGYIVALTVASSGTPDVFFKILAYLPPTAPFCMPVLVALGDVMWWQFFASVLITMAGTVGTAIFAARVYRRAVLRTGGRVRLRELFARSSG